MDTGVVHKTQRAGTLSAKLTTPPQTHRHFLRYPEKMYLKRPVGTATIVPFTASLNCTTYVTLDLKKFVSHAASATTID